MLLAFTKKLYHRFRWLNYNYGDFSRPIKRNAVNVYYFKRQGNVDNVGDLLSLVIVDFMKRKLLIVDSRLRSTKRLFAIGSIIDMAKSTMTIWGSGLRNFKSSPPKYRLDVRAVRGPRTREKLLQSGVDCPEVYGDPALLLPLFYDKEVPKSKEYIIVTHYSKEKFIPAVHQGNLVTTLTSDWTGFIDDIRGAQYVLCGSLHALIIAEAYNVPAILIKSEIDNDLFKYEDYYYSTKRFDYNIAATIDEALEQRVFNEPIPNLSDIQNNLINSFPVDLWNN